MKRLLVILLPLLLTACSLIDDDLSVCGTDVEIDYRLQLYTDLRLQLQTELDAVTDTPVRQALEQWLAPVFEVTEADVDLRFYSTVTDKLSVHMLEMLREKRTSFTITLPKENYMHLAVANLKGTDQVQLSEGEHAATMHIAMADVPQVNSLNAGIFTARMPIEINDSSKSIEVSLYMITSAVALVIDTTGCKDIVSIKGFMAGSANQFSVQDSTFSYDKSPSVVLEEVPVTSSTSAPARLTQMDDYNPNACMATVSMATQDDQKWQIELTATLTNNRHTTTTLTVNEPLSAGSLRIIRLQMNEDGGMVPVNTTEVGGTIALDWKKGNDHEIDL